jgi:hypothetical protein
LAVVLIALAAVSSCWASDSVTDADETAPVVTKRAVTSQLMVPGKGVVRLSYSLSKRILTLSVAQASVTVNRVEQGKNPELIGAEGHIRILPLRLQPYLSSGKIVFLFAERTRDNNGGGQCGSGEELYLQIAELTAPSPKVVSKILIGSCSQGIDLMNSDTPHAGLLSAFSVIDGKLQIEFLSYMSRTEGFIAGLSSNFSTLIFH